MAVTDALLEAANEQPPEPKQPVLADKFQVAIVFVVFVVMRAMDRVFNKRVNDRMVNYQLMYVNVFWPIGVQIMTYVLCAAYVCYQRFHVGDASYSWSFFGPRASIATPSGRYPQWRLACFSVWDQLNAMATGLPSPFIDQTSQSIMSNFVVVWTVLISIPYLGMRYSLEHYLGCILILLSCAVAVTVQLQTGHPPLGQYKNANGTYSHSSASWYILYILGTVPSGISNCYKQKCLKGVDLEVMYATLWSGNWQIMWGLLLFPLNWVPLPAPAQTQTPAAFGSYLQDTITCFMGTAPNASSPLDAVCASAGGSAFEWFLVYLLFNVTFNVLLLWLTKRMSATWATIATVLCLDLTCLFSMSPALMGDEAQPMTLQQYLSLAIAAVAMLVYNLKPELNRDGVAIEGAHAFEDRAPTVASYASDRASFIGRASYNGRRTTASRSHHSDSPLD